MTESAIELYTDGWVVDDVSDCKFYHVMDVPGFGVVGLSSPDGAFDLRQHEDEYLGHADFRDRRILEIGPASGCLTYAMEARGAQVLAVELGPDAEWDLVPIAGLDIESVTAARTSAMTGVRNSFWFTHARYGSAARVHYGDVYALPDALGHFDVAVLAAVLLHTRNPWRIIEECARFADQVVITELSHPELNGSPTVRLAPKSGSMQSDTWWDFSPDILVRYLEILGFSSFEVTQHVQTLVVGEGEHPIPMFTIVASRAN